MNTIWLTSKWRSTSEVRVRVPIIEILCFFAVGLSGIAIGDYYLVGIGTGGIVALTILALWGRVAK